MPSCPVPHPFENTPTIHNPSNHRRDTRSQQTNRPTLLWAVGGGGGGCRWNFATGSLEVSFVSKSVVVWENVSPIICIASGGQAEPCISPLSLRIHAEGVMAGAKGSGERADREWREAVWQMVTGYESKMFRRRFEDWTSAKHNLLSEVETTG